MPNILRATLVALIIVVPWRGAGAQRPQVALSVGLGGGWAGTTCTGCVASNENGPAGLVRATVRSIAGLRLGAEYDRWSKWQYGERSAFDYYLAVAELTSSDLPAMTATFGVGYGRTRYRQWDVSAVPTTTQRDGLAYSIGVSYEMRLRDHLSVAPYAQVIATRKGAALVDGAPDDTDHSTGVLQYGILLRGWR